MPVKKGDLVQVDPAAIYGPTHGVGLVLYTMHRHPTEPGDDGVCNVVVWFAQKKEPMHINPSHITVLSSI